MKSAVASFQRFIFIILLYGSSVAGFVQDIFNVTNRAPVFAAWDVLVLLLALLSLYYIPKAFGSILLLVLLVILFNFTYSQASIFTSLNGIREILMFLALPVFYYKVFSEGNEDETQKYVDILRNFAWFYLLLQIPVSLYQYSQHGASDFVGGSYGNFASGAMTVIIICLVFFLFQFQMPVWKQVLLYCLMLPLVLNETKISFILVPAMVMFNYFEPKIKNILLAAVGGALILLVLSQVYKHEDVNLDDSMTSVFNKDFLSEYLFANDDLHQDVPRFTKIILGYNLISEETNTLFFGMEYGVFRGTSSGAVSQFAQNWAWLLNGTRPFLFYLMIQGGLLLVISFYLIILHINNYFKRANKYVIFYFLILLALMCYQDSLRMHNFAIVYFFLVFFGNSSLYDQNKALPDEDSDSID